MSAILLVLAGALAQAAPTWRENHEQAFIEAKAARKPVLIEFQAPWCYSCYYMEHNVLSGSAFARASERLVLLKADVDQEQGRVLKEKYGVAMLPGFVVLGPDGAVLGRMAGEQAEADFLERLQAFVQGADGGPDEQAVRTLQQRLAAGETDRAARELAKMPPASLRRLRLRRDWRILEARLALKRGQPSVAQALKTLLELEDSCDLAYDIDDAQSAVAAAPLVRRKSLLKMEQAALESLSRRRLFQPAPGRCADFRSGIVALAAVYEKLGERPVRAALLQRTLAFLDGMGLKTGMDRNHDDDKRYFLELAGDAGAMRGFYAELVAAYPADYVYAYRYSRYLLQKGDAAAALRWAESADKLAYGANRLDVTLIRAKALSALGRSSEAVMLLKRDIKSGHVFSDKTHALAELLRRLSS